MAVWLDLVPAVTIVDGLLARNLVDPGGLRRLAESRRGRRGARRAARVFDLADMRAQSPPESVLRVRLVLAGLPRPEPQHPVALPNGAVFHPDLPWPAYRVAAEYAGEWHGAPEQFHHDRRRLNQLLAAGWIVLHATKQHLHGRGFAGFVRQTRDALRSRGWRGGWQP